MILTPREEQIATLVAQGKSNTEISESLGLTRGTVKEYVNKIFHKLGLHNRTELAMWFLKR